MLKMTIRLLQWLQNVQKHLAGLFRHLVWPKNDKGVHPSLGLHLLVQLPMDHLYYLLKVLKNVLYNAQNSK